MTRLRTSLKSAPSFLRTLRKEWVAEIASTYRTGEALRDTLIGLASHAARFFFCFHQRWLSRNAIR